MKNDRPPIPDHPGKRHEWDTQKGLWGGKSHRAGRRLFANLLRATKSKIFVDLIVELTDGSLLKPPVVFHLHETYTKSVQHIRKIRSGSQSRAIYEEVGATGVYTVGAQVRDKSGKWIGLEYDLSALPGLPSGFQLKETHPPPRILFLAANPSTQDELDLRREFGNIRRKLAKRLRKKQASLFLSDASRPADMVRAVVRQAPHVLHFAGHGQIGGLQFPGSAKSPGPARRIVVEPQALSDFLDKRGISLLVLNACYSGMQAKTLRRRVKTIVGSTADILDEAAQEFSETFYEYLADGQTIGDALRNAKDTIAMTYGSVEQYYKSTGDLNWRLFEQSSAPR